MFSALLPLLLIFAQTYCDNELSKATADLSISLLKQSGQANKNVFFSPTSISICMGMVHAGAKGQTKSQINRAVFGGLSNDVIRTNGKSLITKLGQLTRSGYDLDVANRAYVSKNVTLLDAYKQTLTDHFSSDLTAMDFGQAEAARITMNQWVERKTKDKIKELIPQGAITPQTKMVLINALYFKSTWQVQFNKSKTVEMEFHKSENEKVNCTMMIGDFKDEVYESETENSHVLGLPYKNESMIMYFVLPRKRFGLSQLERSLTGQELINLFNGAVKRRKNSLPITVIIPKFKLSEELKLKDALKKMNVTDLFNDNADLSGISGDRSLSVSDAIHKAAIEVNEEGSEASAATAAVSGFRSMPPSFAATRPFLFAIVHRETKAILFFGRFAGPIRSVRMG